MENPIDQPFVSICIENPSESKELRRKDGLIYCMLSSFECNLSPADFFKISFFKKIFHKCHQRAKQLGSRSSPTKISGLIVVQTVFKGYQQTALACKELRVCLCIGVGQ